MTNLHLKETIPPHTSVRVDTRGNIETAQKALLLLHGRFSNGDEILRLAEHLKLPDDYVVLAPNAVGGQWYPQRFIAPQSDNQPFLNSALQLLTAVLHELTKTHNIAADDVIIAGFSQGACLAAEFLVTQQTTPRALALFSGGVIGSKKEVTEKTSTADLSGLPVYLGVDAADPHIPLERAKVTAQLFSKAGAQTDLDIYENFGHSIHPRGITFLQNQLDR